MHNEQHDAFGFGIAPKTEEQRKQEMMAKDHINVWNRLIENKGPLGIKQDDMMWAPRFNQLMDDQAFRSFMNADNVKDKIVVLRDAGLGPNKDMSDQDLAQFLMTNVPSGLTGDVNVSEEAKMSIGMSREEFKERYNPPEEFMDKYFAK